MHVEQEIKMDLNQANIDNRDQNNYLLTLVTVRCYEDDNEDGDDDRDLL